MKKFILSLLMILGVTILIGFNDSLWAQQGQQDITATLTFDKTYYIYGEPIGAEVTVCNTTDTNLYVSKGFSTLVYYREIRLIDPAGRLISPQANEDHIEFPDAPPLAYYSYNGNLIQVAPCEILPPGCTTSRSNDLTANYPFKLSGNYSGEVQLSVMQFETIIETPDGYLCSMEDIPTGKGARGIKSGPHYVFNEGGTEIKIIPNQWKITWANAKNPPYVEVQIRPVAGKTVNDYSLNKDDYRLNSVVPAKDVKVVSSMLKVYFDMKSALKTLEPVQIGQWYPGVVSGVSKDKQYFGGSQPVRVVNE